MIEMTMRQQDAIEPPKAGTTAQQLALRALAAIDQDALACHLHQKGRMVALRRGNAGRGAEKCQGEHGGHASSGTLAGLSASNATRAAARTGRSTRRRARRGVRGSHDQTKNAKTTPCTVQIIEEFRPTRRARCPARTFDTSGKTGAELHHPPIVNS